MVVVAPTGCLNPGSCDTDSIRSMTLTIMDKYVLDTVRIPLHEVRRNTGEHYESPIRRQRRIYAVSICLRSVTRDADAFHATRLPVHNKDVANGVAVTLHQIARETVECDKPTI